MTLFEAYDFTMQKVNELKEDGIKVIIKPSNSREIKSTLKKYDIDGNLPSLKWFHVSFQPTNDSQIEMVTQAADYLGLCGIRFDTGGCRGQRDWEIDWSFKYIKGTENWDLREARKIVEDNIKKL